MSRQFWLDRLARIELQIVAIEDALIALGPDSDIQSYTLDTGQQRQTVTRADQTQLQARLSSLLALYETLSARVGRGDGTNVVRPAW